MCVFNWKIVDWDIADLKHLLDGRDAGDGLFGELTDAVRKRTGQLAVNVDRASAHAFDDSRVLGFVAVQASEDEVLARTSRAAQNAKNLDLHGLRR